MPVRKLLFILLALCCCGNQVRSQSVGINFESNAFNVSNFFHNEITAEGRVKNFYLSASYSLTQSLKFYLRSGYGWNNYNSRVTSTVGDTIKSSYTANTAGIPSEAELIYSAFAAKEKKLQPFAGIGAGYYDYKTKYKRIDWGRIYENEFRTTGICFFASLGADMEIMESLSLLFRLKYNFLNGLKTKWEDKSENRLEKMETDYGSAQSVTEISLSLGIYYSF